MTPTQRQISTGIVFGLLGYAANWARLELFFGVDILFGSFLVMLALLLYGGTAGIIAGVMASLCTWQLWHHPWAVVSFAGEVLFVAWWLRTRSRDLIIADILYWLCLGAPFLWFSYHHLLGMAPQPTILVMLKQGVNGFMNVLAATVAVQLLRVRSPGSDGLLSLRQMLSATIMTFALFPALLYLALDARSSLRRDEARLIRETAQTAEQARGAVMSLLDRHEITGFSPGAVDPALLRATLATIADPVQQQITLVNRAGQVIVSTRPELTALEQYRQRTGWTSHHLAEGVSRWVPRPGQAASPMQLWHASRYLKELPLGPRLPWSVVVETSPVPMLATLETQSIAGLSQMFCLIILTVIFSRLASDRLLRPLLRLQSVTGDLPRQIAGGQGAVSWPESGISEIQGLIANFREMADGLTRYVRELHLANDSLEERITRRTGLLQEKTAVLSALLGSLPDLVFFKDRDGVYLGTNLIQAQEFGRTPDEVVGATDDDFFAPEVARAFRENDRIVLESGTIRTFVESVILRDGRSFQAETVKAPLVLPSGEIIGLVGIARDITERLRHEEELTQARTAAEAASRAKSAFLATMSHELRTPLNAILGLAEILREGVMGDVTTEQQKALVTIEESGRHLLAIITDILDLTQIEAERLQLQEEACDLAELCTAVLGRVRRVAESRKISLGFRMIAVPPVLMTDSRRLRQIIGNLLDNGMKFTPAGGEVSLTVTGDRERGEVRFDVADTGIGIAPDDLEQIFHPFFQSDSRLSRKYEGTGLGLALVARLSELLGGTVSVASEPGKGSRFTVTLPWRGGGEQL